MSADLEKMAAAFNTTISALEDELMALILEGQIQARIDSHNKVNLVFCFVPYCLMKMPRRAYVNIDNFFFQF